MVQDHQLRRGILICIQQCREPLVTLAVAGPLDLGEVGDTLRLRGTLLTWQPVAGVGTYNVRRSIRADFIRTNPVPDPTHVLGPAIGPSSEDSETPGVGGVFHYFVTATAACARESSY